MNVHGELHNRILHWNVRVQYIVLKNSKRSST